TTFAGHEGAVTCFQAAGDTLVSGSSDRTVREWDLATGVQRQTLDLAWGSKAVPSGDAYVAGTERGDGGFIGALQFLDCALATGTADGVLRLWDLRTGQAHRKLAAGHRQPITSLCFDDRHVVSGSLDCSALLWDLRMGRVVQPLEFAGSVTSVQLAPALRAAEFWVAASDHCLHHYRADSMQRTAYVAGGRSIVTRVCCRAGDTLVTGDSAGIVKLWKI
ncbi:Mitochondrial fission protein, partial [Coemansia aciculifera]